MFCVGRGAWILTTRYHNPVNRVIALGWPSTVRCVCPRDICVGDTHLDSGGLPCTIIYGLYDCQRWASGAETMPSIGALTVHRIRDLVGEVSGHEDDMATMAITKRLGSSVLKTGKTQTDCFDHFCLP